MMQESGETNQCIGEKNHPCMGIALKGEKGEETPEEHVDGSHVFPPNESTEYFGPRISFPQKDQIKPSECGEKGEDTEPGKMNGRDVRTQPGKEES